MANDLIIPGYTIRPSAEGKHCSGTYHSHDLGRPEIGKCPTNPIFAIYKAGSEIPDYRCWKHFREFVIQNPTAVADIVIQLLLKEQLDS